MCDFVFAFYGNACSILPLGIEALDLRVTLTFLGALKVKSIMNIL